MTAAENGIRYRGVGKRSEGNGYVVCIGSRNSLNIAYIVSSARGFGEVGIFVNVAR